MQKTTPAKPKQPQGSKLTKRPVTASRGGASTQAPASGTTKKSATAIAAAQKRESQRKQLLEMRRQNRMAMASAPNTTNDNVIANQKPNDALSQSKTLENGGETESDR